MLTSVYRKLGRAYSTPEPDQRRSLDTVFHSKTHMGISSAPPRKYHGYQLSLRPKATTGSLRQRLHGKRDSLISTSTRQSFDSDISITGPETFITPPIQAQDYKKDGAIAKTIVGSLRGIRYKHKKNNLLPTPTVGQSVATEDELSHSSPIDIPSAAPALDNLDFGATSFALSPPTVVGSPNDQQTSFLPVPGSVGYTSSTENSCELTPNAGTRGSNNLLSKRHPIAPRDILRLHFNDDIKAAPAAPAPPTPMPGTDFALEIDGAWGTNNEVFERSVLAAGEEQRQKLRSMQSLNAMAEACTVAHSADEVGVTLPEESHGVEAISSAVNAASPMDSPVVAPSAATQAAHYKTRRNLASADTVHTIPSYMSELTRQNSPHNSVVDVAPEGFDDPFADRDALNSGPAKPTRSMTLPFRPKAHSHQQSLAGLEDGPLEPIDIDSKGSGEENIATSSAESLHSLGAQLQLQRSYAIADGLAQVERLETGREAPQESDPFRSIGSADDIVTRAQELSTSDIILPNYDNLGSEDDKGMSSQTGSLPSTFRCRTGSISLDPSPGSTRSRSSYTAGLGDAQYVFSFDNWLRDSSGATSPDHPMTPSRTGIDTSTAAVTDAGEWDTTVASSPTWNPPIHTLSFINRPGLRHSSAESNMRYNAAQIRDANGTIIGIVTPGEREPNVILGAIDITDAGDIQFSSFNNAYEGSPYGAAQRNDGSMQIRAGSDESVAQSIRNAARDYDQLQKQLNEPKDVFADPLEGVEEPFRFDRSTTPSPVKGKRKNSTLEPLSSPDSGYQADASSTGVGRSSPFAKQ